MHLNPRASRPQRHCRSGFLLMEVLLALAVFGIAATGFAVALHETADLADAAQTRLNMTRLLESALTEAMSLPVLEEGTTSVAVEEMSEDGLEVETNIELMDKIENQDGQILQEMYRIEVVARWFKSGIAQEESAETWRYSRLYQP
jgi:type II secretory pathway pseudopilin PulG